jgi:hypothetical protein
MDNSETINLSLEQETFMASTDWRRLAIPQAFRFRGALDRDALGRAIAEVVRRHDPLRMRLVDTPSGVRQYFVPATRDCCITESRLESSDQEQGISDWVNELVGAPLDLTLGPIAVDVLTVGKEDSVLLVRTNHLATDGISMGILERELLASYAAEVGRRARLPELEYAFRDYIAQQCEAGEFLTQPQMEYWSSQFSDYRPREVEGPKEAGGLGPQFVVEFLDKDAVASLQTVAKRNRVGEFSLLCSAAAVALWIEFGEGDVRLTLPYANRDSVRVSQLIGLFMKGLSMRVSLDPTSSISDLIHDSFESWITSRKLSKPPFGNMRMLRELSEAGVPEARRILRKIAGDAAGEQAVDVAVNYVPADRYADGESVEPSLQDVVSVDRIPIPQNFSSPYELVFVLSAANDGSMYPTLLYNPDAVEKDRADRLLQYMVNCLKFYMEQTAGTLGDLRTGILGAG